MSEANRLFPALTNCSVVPIELVRDLNPFVFGYLDRWKRQCESLLSMIQSVEVKRRHRPTEFHFIDAKNFRAVCFSAQNCFYIGFSVSAVLQVFDLYIHIVNSQKYLVDVLPTTELADATNFSFSPLRFDAGTIEKFPRETPRSLSHLEAAIRLSFTVLEFMLWHEVTHLWDGHGEYKKLRQSRGFALSNIELRTLEWEADRLSVSRMMLMYRSGEHVIPLVKALAAVVDAKGGEALFDSTIANPRTYVRYVLFSVLLFFWHFDEPVNQRYLDKNHPHHAARSFYFLSELGRVLTHWVYEPWKISMNEYMTEIARPTMQDAITCWDQVAGEERGTINMCSVFHQPYALRDLKRFEATATRIQMEIRQNGLGI